MAEAHQKAYPNSMIVCIDSVLSFLAKATIYRLDGELCTAYITDPTYKTRSKRSGKKMTACSEKIRISRNGWSDPSALSVSFKSL